MKSLKSTLVSFKENELSNQQKLSVYGGLTDGGSLPGNELGDEEFDDPNYDENGNPIGNAGPRGTGGTSSASSGSSLGNSNTGVGNPLGGI